MTRLLSTRKTLSYFLFSLIAALVLSGCGLMTGASVSPEAAAQRAVLNNPNPNMRVDPNSVQVRQRYQLDGKTLVMLSFQGNDIESGAMSCMFVYEVNRMPLGGWNTGSGGGGCSSDLGNPETQPLTIGAGISSGGRPMDPGVSTVYGHVLVPEIRTVQVTWKDDMMQQVEVINASYMAARAGQVEWERIEGLNADQEVIYTSDIEFAPEKQQIEEEKNDANP